jgi:hypothetical protein
MKGVRGALPFILKKYIKDNFGNDFYNEILDSLSIDGRNIIDGVLASSKMYSLTAYTEFLDAFANKAGKEELMKFGRSKAEHQLRGLYGFITKLMSRDMMAKRVSKIFTNTYNHGRMLLAENTPKRITLKVDDFEYTESLAWVSLAIIERVIEISTGKTYHSLFKHVDEKTTLFIFNVV